MAGIRLEWFGATTFRLKANGVTIFLDTWLERPSVLPQYLSVSDVDEADYIFISHAHFDHLPGADRIAIKTGAIVIGNNEVINELRKAHVPEEQLIAVSGGERIPLFEHSIRVAAQKGEVQVAPAPSGAPVRPHPDLAAFSVHVWPSLHCFLPGNAGDHPDVIDTATVYTGEAHPYFCTMDINIGMQHGLLKIDQLVPKELRDPGLQSFIDYVSDRERHIFSAHDGGQLAYNILIDHKAVFWSAHLGAYDSILKTMQPKPDLAILAIAGRANLNGRPYNGSAAQFALEQVRWLGEPKHVIWCLHDESPIKPCRIDTTAAQALIESSSSTKILMLQPNKVTSLLL